MTRTRISGREFESPPISARFWQALRRYFVTGLATLFPAAVTVWLLVQIFRFADGFLGRLLGFSIPGLGLVVTLCITVLVGVLSTHFVGRLLFPTLEQWFSRLPLVKKIYPAVKQLARFIFSEEERHAAFRRVVLVEYPRPGAYSIAFVTNETTNSATGTPKTLLTVLIPNPPSPFTGPIIFVPKADAIPLDLSVEDAVKLVMSGGVVAPPFEAAERSTG